jgi:hypothetical protein
MMVLGGIALLINTVWAGIAGLALVVGGVGLRIEAAIDRRSSQS